MELGVGKGSMLSLFNMLKANAVPHLYFGSICAAKYTPMFCLLLLVQLALSLKNHLPGCLVIIATCG